MERKTVNCYCIGRQILSPLAAMLATSIVSLSSSSQADSIEAALPEHHEHDVDHCSSPPQHLLPHPPHLLLLRHRRAGVLLLQGVQGLLQ